MNFPATRMRRLRRTKALRALARETRLHRADLILPMFVVEGSGVQQALEALPGVHRYSTDLLAEECKRVYAAGVPGVILFGVPEASAKDARGSGADAADGIVQRAVAAIKKSTPELIVMTDVCLCEYTSHGHCGIVKGAPGAEQVANDASVARVAAAALSHARAGADVVAPSDMMDGRVAAIRAQLDANSFEGVAVLSYAAKFASAFYEPFREAAQSAPAFGDRRGYQMDSANGREALREMQLDLQEGADALMVKPALPSLDVLAAARRRFDAPLAAYQVSGEYAMIHAAAARGFLDAERALRETLLAIKRAGADWILTYAAKDLPLEGGE